MFWNKVAAQFPRPFDIALMCSSVLVNSVLLFFVKTCHKSDTGSIITIHVMSGWSATRFFAVIGKTKRLRGKNPHGSRSDYTRLRESITSIDDISAMHPVWLCHWRLSTSFLTVSTVKVKVDGVDYVRLCPQANSFESWFICLCEL